MSDMCFDDFDYDRHSDMCDCEECSSEIDEHAQQPTNSKSMSLPEDAVVDRCKRFEECPASGKGHAGCYSSVGCFL